jgi:type VI secretion system secreted protein VgrG
MTVLSTLRALLGDQPLFTFEVPGAGDLRVVRFYGREGLSSLFEFRLELAGPELDLAALIDRPGLLTIAGVDVPRRVHGVVVEVEDIGRTRGFHLYEVTLVPWIWRLQHRETCRIFQDLTTPQILAQVLTDAGLPRDWLRLDLIAGYAPRNYCVQYRESDLAFISRLMEEDGIFYAFEHAEDRHVLALGDHPGAHPPIPGVPALWYIPPGGALVADREHVDTLRFAERVRPGRVTLRDHNLHRTDLAMEVQESARQHAELEVYAYPGEYQDPALGGPHQGRSLAKLRLDGLQAARRGGVGGADCARLTAGHTFALVGHPRAELDTTYRILHVAHVGHQPQVLDQDAAGDSSYRSEFAISALDQPYRPPRATPRPVMRGLQTATVVGPAGEEVFPDEHARVKVQFHWDRAEPFDETSSCWVRVSQLWAGNGWGAMFLPRIGHEVLVDFLEGDPDRPVIVGRIYTGTNKPPYPLPDDKTRSTIKSDSSLGGGGSNELRFDDKKGSEEVYLHAQKDLVELVEHDNTRTVKNDQTFRIDADQSFSVGGNQSFTVSGDRTVGVTKTETTTVKLDRKVIVEEGASSLQVATLGHAETARTDISMTSQTANVTVHAHKGVSLTAGTAKLEGTAKLDVALTSQTADVKLHAHTHAELIAATATLTVQGHTAATLASATTSATVTAPELVSLFSPLKVDVQGAAVSVHGIDKLELSVGACSIVLEPGGISISAPKITSSAAGVHEISGAVIKLN